MPNTSNTKSVHSLGWVLIANAARARSFVRDADNNAMRELCSFVHPESREKGMALGTDRGGLVHKGVPSTQFAPHTDPHEKEHVEFARELAQYLEEAALGHRYPELAIIAAKGFLGDLRAHLGPATQRLLRASVPLDLTTAVGADLEHRVAQALLAAK
jgi:protein required for attachment to host cells